MKCQFKLFRMAMALVCSESPLLSDSDGELVLFSVPFPGGRYALEPNDTSQECHVQKHLYF